MLTCGSVDDGKSTLIGRLLWDAGALHTDQRQTLQRSAKTAAGTPDFSLLVDGLAAEREQGITIDIAWRYFDTPARRLVIIDSPGHEQYTRNMATGASHADVAILLVDARTGVKVQTRRHAAILDLMGVARVVLAVNKMDLVDWSEARFRDIEAEFLALAAALRLQRCGRHSGLGRARRQRRQALARPCAWYDGPGAARASAADAGAADAGRTATSASPCRWWSAPARTFRGLGRHGGVRRASASATKWSTPSAARRARVKRIVTMGRDLESAGAGQAVVLQLDTDIDVSRGAVLASPDRMPTVVRSLDARLVWLSDEPFNPTAAICCARRPTSSRLRRSASRRISTWQTLTERPASDLRRQRHRASRASNWAGGPSSSCFRSSARPAASC